MDEKFHIECLKHELQKRCESNANYSLRSFARMLDVDVGNLSRYLTYKLPLGKRSAEKISGRLVLDPETREKFLESARVAKSQVPFNDKDKSAYREIDNQWFDIIGNWYHYAIAELTLVDDFSSDPRWLAKRLGITTIRKTFHEI